MPDKLTVEIPEPFLLILAVYGNMVKETYLKSCRYGRKTNARAWALESNLRRFKKSACESWKSVSAT